MKRPNLNRELALEALQRTADGAGGFTEAWQQLGTLWAEVQPRSGRLAEGDAGAVSVTGFRFVVRGAPDGHSARPVAGQRFLMGNRIFRIEAVTEAEPKGFYLNCHCEEELAV
ncbi:phage head closure protein [uncultured Pelagimonas sp.]|uniref:phage head closure protein n=1 Tax=uncultured Pelagimonas sp. TaxID=1618102 RepID=UPI00261773B0|nr:phage head closure protein [uncultured Pelagimonas sp.]